MKTAFNGHLISVQQFNLLCAFALAVSRQSNHAINAYYSLYPERADDFDKVYFYETHQLNWQDFAI
jgi:hypothetical protein